MMRVCILLMIGLMLVLPLQAQETDEVVSALREVSYPLEEADDYGQIMEIVGDAEVVLIGEATHGTHEFYQIRAEITQRLIEEKGFTAVAIEGDWPSADRVNAYIQGRNVDNSAEEALSDFVRFPTWMWRNTVVQDFVEWLAEREGHEVGFYGLDVYSFNESQQAVLDYLDAVNPEMAAEARERYACFQNAPNAETYGSAVASGRQESCTAAAEEQLAALEGMDITDSDDAAQDAYFSAVQNARVVVGAELYYRTAFQGGESSWNLRDTHMFETLEAIRAHHERQGQAAKVVVWAHNSHVGDARATDMSLRGEFNIGQLAREAYGDDAVLIGFSTYTGTVTAADNWDEPPQFKRVRPGMEDSFEQLFNEVDIERFMVTAEDMANVLEEPKLQRAIGVIYRPATERMSHYFYAHLPAQFDLVIHINETSALRPLEPNFMWRMNEIVDAHPAW